QTSGGRTSALRNCLRTNISSTQGMIPRGDVRSECYNPTSPRKKVKALTGRLKCEDGLFRGRLRLSLSLWRCHFLRQRSRPPDRNNQLSGALSPAGNRRSVRGDESATSFLMKCASPFWFQH